jgi:putative flippase GtrA
LSPEIIVRRLSVLSALICGWGRQLHRYTLVGGLVFLIDLVSYWLLMTVAGSWFLYAHFVSRTIGGASCFLLNRYVTFRRSGMAGLGGELIRFGLLYAGSFVLSSGLVYAYVELARLGPMSGKVVAECTVFLFNYTVMKYWVLRPTTSRG